MSAATGTNMPISISMSEPPPTPVAAVSAEVKKEATTSRPATAGAIPSGRTVAIASKLASDGGRLAELTHRAVLPEIAGQDRVHRLRANAERRKGAVLALSLGRHHVVLAQQLDLVGGQQRVRQQAEDAALQLGEAPRQRDERALAVRHLEQLLHALLERDCLRSAELINLAALQLAIDGASDHFGN